MKKGVAAAILVCAVSLVLAPAAARAASCSFTSVTGPAFGNYDVFSAAATDAAGNIAYSCTGGAMLTITLSTGNAPTFSPRFMLRAGGFHLNYNLYLDAGHAQVWGDGTGSSFVSGPTSPADNAVVMVPIFASVPPNQDVGLGAYSDTVTVTLNF